MRNDFFSPRRDFIFRLPLTPMEHANGFFLEFAVVDVVEKFFCGIGPGGHR
jgi:hypothetical protein